MKDLGNNDLTYLGISIQKKHDGIYINQSKYLEKVLIKYGMENCKGVQLPMDVNYVFDEACEIDLSYENICRSLIGSLMYATVGSRPDLAMSVYYLSRYQNKPSSELLRALKRILRYVKQTIDFQLVYSKGSNVAYPLIGYADADFARDNDRKSTSGYLFMLYDNTIIWKSKKQSTVALSSTEAEFVSLCEAAVEACWLKKLLKELNVDLCNILLYEDNQSTIKSVKNSDQKRLKHMDVKYNFVKEKVENGDIKIDYVCTREQLADVLTKPICNKQFCYLINKLGIRREV